MLVMADRFFSVYPERRRETNKSGPEIMRALGLGPCKRAGDTRIGSKLMPSHLAAVVT
jgi:hypothetical protein